MSANSGQIGYPIPITAEVVAGRDPSGNVKYLSIDAQGNVKVAVTGAGSGGTSSNFADTFPAAGTAIGFKDSTGALMVPGNLDASGNLKVSGTLTTTPPAASTSVLSNVSDNVASVTLLSANAARLAFTLYNDSGSACYIKFGATASATSFVKKLLPNEFFSTLDIGVNYTGRIDCIWVTAPGGAMRVTELSA